MTPFDGGIPIRPHNITLSYIQNSKYVKTKDHIQFMARSGSDAVSNCKKKTNNVWAKGKEFYIRQEIK